MAVHVVRTQGVLALYNGLSASLTRQLTYSTTRYGLYEVVSAELRKGDAPLPFYQKIAVGAMSGFVGAFIGNPADMVNVRMQNDVKIMDVTKRRNYKHVFDGLYRTATEEGIATWMKGVQMTSFRAVLITVAQVACYDQTKQLLLTTGYFSDNMLTHFTASFIAGTIAAAHSSCCMVCRQRTQFPLALRIPRPSHHGRSRAPSAARPVEPGLHRGGR